MRLYLGQLKVVKRRKKLNEESDTARRIYVVLSMQQVFGERERATGKPHVEEGTRQEWRQGVESKWKQEYNGKSDRISSRSTDPLHREQNDGRSRTEKPKKSGRRGRWKDRVCRGTSRKGPGEEGEQRRRMDNAERSRTCITTWAAAGTMGTKAGWEGTSAHDCLVGR